LTDIIDLIDQAITPTCAQCGAELGDSLSNYYCGPDCQKAWNEARSVPLVGYREPSDLEAHYSNQIELANPETMPDRPDDGYDGYTVVSETPARDPFRSLRDRTRGLPAARRIVVTSNPCNPGGTSLPSYLTDDRTYRWFGPRRTHLLDTGAPWIRSLITPALGDYVNSIRLEQRTDTPTVAMFIGGSRHGQTIPVTARPQQTIEVYVTRAPTLSDAALFLADTIRFERRFYHLSHHAHGYWYYLYDQHNDTVVPATDRHPELTIERYHQDFPRDTSSARVTDGEFHVVGNFPNQLLADHPALRAWFAHHRTIETQRVTDGSWEITEPRPPFRREQT
jgi:hypothetical protein